MINRLKQRYIDVVLPHGVVSGDDAFELCAPVSLLEIKFSS